MSIAVGTSLREMRRMLEEAEAAMSALTEMYLDQDLPGPWVRTATLGLYAVPPAILVITQAFGRHRVDLGLAPAAVASKQLHIFAQ